MEDASKAIELAVGVIIFIVALTIAILLYNKLADTANNALTINETQNSVTFNKNKIPSDFGYIYTPEDIYYFIQDIRENSEDEESIYSELDTIFICKGHVNGSSTTEDIASNYKPKTKYDIKASDVYGINFSDSRYKIKYDYEYNEKDVLTELNNHKPRSIYIIQYVETL